MLLYFCCFFSVLFLQLPMQIFKFYINLHGPVNTAYSLTTVVCCCKLCCVAFLYKSQTPRIWNMGCGCGYINYTQVTTGPKAASHKLTKPSEGSPWLTRAPKSLMKLVLKQRESGKYRKSSISPLSNNYYFCNKPPSLITGLIPPFWDMRFCNWSLLFHITKSTSCGPVGLFLNKYTLKYIIMFPFHLKCHCSCLRFVQKLFYEGNGERCVKISDEPPPSAPSLLSPHFY